MHTSNPNDPAIISLPDDDPHTMTILCQFLHYEDAFPELVVSDTIPSLRKFAILCDK